MPDKKSYPLRLDKELFEALDHWAQDEFRSLNGQLEWVIYQALKKAGRLPKSKKDTSNNKKKS